MPETNHYRLSLNRIADDIGGVLGLIDNADPAEFNELQNLIARVKAALAEAGDRCAAEPSAGDEARAKYCQAIRRARSGIEASRWNARPNRDFEHVLREARGLLMETARGLE